MALTPQIRSTQAAVRAVTEGVPDLRVSQAVVRTLIGFPAEAIRATQAAVRTLGEPDLDIRVSQAVVRTVVRGRIGNHHVRAWTFTLDGHDFYVLRLGSQETLIYDTTTKQWARFANSDKALWWFSTGRNWLGARLFAGTYGSNIICGDDTLGQLWILDPRQAYDDNPLDDDGEPVNFLRRITGQLVARRTTAIPCYEVFLTADLGDPVLTAPDISLLTSDDGGHTYFDHGTVTITAGDYDQRVAWIGLGQITAPGRLFRIEDSGAVARIDALDMTESLNGSAA